MKEFTIEDLKSTIRSSNIPILVMFRTKWCKMCDVDEILIKKFQKNHNKEFVFCYIDVEKNKLWREQDNSEFIIDKVPTYYIYYKQNLIFNSNKAIDMYELDNILFNTKK